MTTAGVPVAVTGMAWTTALGDDLEAVWQRLLSGEDGFAPSACAFPVRNAHVAACAQHQDRTPGQRLRALAVDAASRAARAAGVDPSGAQLVIATSLGAYLEDDEERDLGAWADDVASALGAPPPVCISTACSSSADAILVGAELIRAGAADVCMCGGADVLTVGKRLAHSALSTMSPTRPRAFDRRHDGMLLGEGAGFVVLERETHAAARHAPRWATLRGVGSANDAPASMTAPHPAGAGARLAMQRALDDAGLAPNAVGVVHAHGTATPLNDAVERDVLVAIFGPGPTPVVFATKPALGHTLGATGAIEAIALVLALRDGRIPPIAGLAELDPAMPFTLPRGSAMRHEAHVGVSVTLGFGGFDTALLFEVAR